MRGDVGMECRKWSGGGKSITCFPNLKIHIVFGYIVISFGIYGYLPDLCFDRFHHRETLSIPEESVVTQSLGHLL